MIIHIRYCMIHIRYCMRRDVEAVLAIDGEWGHDEFLRCLKRRNCIGMVAEHREQVIGFMIYELHPHSMEMLRFGVAPHFRRRGVGRQLVEKLAAKLSENRRSRLVWRVDQQKLDAHLFLRACGFRCVRVDDTNDSYTFEVRAREAAEVDHA